MKTLSPTSICRCDSFPFLKRQRATDFREPTAPRAKIRSPRANPLGTPRLNEPVDSWSGPKNEVGHPVQICDSM
ncbi:hypothetical protein Poly24_07900 [Rosistilla carotiformis]|uniref:Uncharacterized protein n=1 Tax=Rosistilla carotiformis TaxID=2528017 RepID=A0A518JNG6_9BACT|nr:hypothetical protein Poly24_07900 [Rosistilla carotiformis]